MSRKTRRAVYKKQRQKGAAPRQPLWIVLGGVLLIGLAAFLIWSSQPAPTVPLEVSGAPSLKVDREKVDLGNVRLGEWVSVSFEVTNAGDQALHFVETPYVEVVEGC